MFLNSLISACPLGMTSRNCWRRQELSVEEYCQVIADVVSGKVAKDLCAVIVEFDVQNNNNPLGLWQLQAQNDNSEEKGDPFVGPKGETIDSTNPKQQKELLDKVVNISKNPPILTGKDLLPNARTGMNQQNQVIVNIEFDDDGTKVFATSRSRPHRRLPGDILRRKAPDVANDSGCLFPTARRRSAGSGTCRKPSSWPTTLTPALCRFRLRLSPRTAVEPTLGAQTVHQVV